MLETENTLVEKNERAVENGSTGLMVLSSLMYSVNAQISVTVLCFHNILFCELTSSRCLSFKKVC